jgi:DNA-binding GntR family transcriptional regulator
MFMLKDPKKTAAMIIAIHKKPEGESGESDAYEAHKDEAKHLLEAIKAGDEEGFMHSLKDFVALCIDEYENEEEANEPEESESPQA